MKNVYTIQLELCQGDCIPYNSLEKIASFMVITNHICLFSELKKTDIRELLLKYLNEESQFIVKLIKKDEIEKLPNRFAEWLKPLVFNDELKDFEKKNQDIINQTMDYLNQLDKKLGGVDSGQKQNRETKKSAIKPTTKSKK